MAERRMFAKTIVCSDMFLELPISAQALYFHLGMQADDDGFVNSPKMIRMVSGACGGDITVLENAGLIIRFSSGVLAIRHWRVNNKIRKDRYRPTRYVEEMSRLKPGGGDAYEWANEGS